MASLVRTQACGPRTKGFAFLSIDACAGSISDCICSDWFVYGFAAGTAACHCLLSNLPIKSIVLCAHDLNLKRISLMDAAAASAVAVVVAAYSTFTSLNQIFNKCVTVQLTYTIIIRYKYCDFFFHSTFSNARAPTDCRRLMKATANFTGTIICPIIDFKIGIMGFGKFRSCV